MLRSSALLLILATANAAAPVQDQLVVQALSVIQKYEALEPSLKAGDVKTANRYLNALRYSAKRLNAAYKKNTTHWKDASKRYEKLVAKIQAKAKAKPAPAGDEGKKEEPKEAGESSSTETTRKVDRRALEALNAKVLREHHNLKSSRIAEFADERRVRTVRERIAGFRAQLRGLPADDSGVKTVAGNVDAIEKLLKLGLEHVRKLSAPGGASAKLDKLEEFYRSFDMLQPLRPPLEAEHVEGWARQVREFRDERMPADLKWLDSVRGKIGIPLQNWQRVRGWVASSWPLKIRGMLEQNLNSIGGPARSAVHFLDATLKLDLEDEHAVKNRVLVEGQLERNMKELEKSKRSLEIAAAYERGLGSKSGIDFAKELKRVEAARAHLLKAAKMGLESVRLPKAASTDEKLIATARKVLAREKYGAGKPLRLVVNSKLKRKQKKEGSITPGTVYSRITLYHYVWDEYQVCTVEREGDTHWLYFNTLRFYHRGGSTTPTGDWILGNRFRTTPILEANLDRK